jgi:hypothetical protein
MSEPSDHSGYFRSDFQQLMRRAGIDLADQYLQDGT